MGASSRPAVRLAGCTLAVVALLAACSSPASVRKDLVQAATDATATVRSGLMALQLLDQGRTTRNHAQMIFVEMNRQLTSAEKMVSDTTLGDPAQMADRDQVLDAVHSATVAVLAGRDCVQTKSSCQPAADRLREADRRLTAVEQKLRSQR